ncbi:MAG: V-type ATP synthase subunit F [Dehalococcoidia bacterium]
MMSISHLNIAVIGDEELVNALRLAGISNYHTIKGDRDVGEDVRKALTELLGQPDVGIVIILEDYAQHVEDMLAQVRKRKGMMPVIIEAPSKFGTRYPDTKGYYRALIRESIGFEVEI